MHNQVFRLLQGSSKDAYSAGIYRVIVDEAGINKTICVCIQHAEPREVNRVGRKLKQKTKRPRTKPPRPLIGQLLWMDRDHLLHLKEKKLLFTVEIEREPIYYIPIDSVKKRKIFAERCNAMAEFLDPLKLKEGILVHAGLGGIVRNAMARTNVSRSFVYKQWSTLCQLGINEVSLIPRHDRCGAPNAPRPCDPGGRNKAGRKTRAQWVAKQHDIVLPPKQPGMSTEWRTSILAADDQIKTVIKPPMPQRCALILESHFVKKYRHENGKLVPIDPKLGDYPNNRQIRRVLEVEIPRLQRLLQRTTLGHFKRSLRGLVARNWKGVAGPGHTWAIDSTVGDIYLRSSINRAWIVGRPIVYIIVDVWSTAVVGFHVCLTGPSWNTAKTSLFNAVADPTLLGELWNYQPVQALNPSPTMCHMLLCDRGEYLSRAASITASRLITDMSYAPPYRPDLKGLVEVLHRIKKDKQFLFLPGAMNFRREEFDLRRSNPEQSAMTVREYFQYLHLIFNEYNLTADRSKRVDAHMAAAGVFPSPAGLWRWGHEMGIAVQRSIPGDDLITQLLDHDVARVGRSSIVYAGNDYSSPTVCEENWTTYARNYCGWTVPINKYPGPVGRIWTPNTHGKGLLMLQISEQAKASQEVTWDEFSDAVAETQIRRSEIEHQRTLRTLETLRKVEALRDNAIKLTAEATGRARGSRPTMTEARIAEVACAHEMHTSEERATEALRDEAIEAHTEMMRAILRAADEEADFNG